MAKITKHTKKMKYFIIALFMSVCSYGQKIHFYSYNDSLYVDFKLQKIYKEVVVEIYKLNTDSTLTPIIAQQLYSEWSSLNRDKMFIKVLPNIDNHYLYITYYYPDKRKERIFYRYIIDNLKR